MTRKKPEVQLLKRVLPTLSTKDYDAFKGICLEELRKEGKRREESISSFQICDTYFRGYVWIQGTFQIMGVGYICFENKNNLSHKTTSTPILIKLYETVDNKPVIDAESTNLVLNTSMLPIDTEENIPYWMPSKTYNELYEETLPRMDVKKAINQIKKR